MAHPAHRRFRNRAERRRWLGCHVSGSGVTTIRAVARGQIVLGSTIGRQGIESFGASAYFPQLTDRENEVLLLVAEGRDNPEIGSRLGISPKTVANHVSTILIKLGVADRSQAAIAAMRAGLVN